MRLAAILMVVMLASAAAAGPPDTCRALVDAAGAPSPFALDWWLPSRPGERTPAAWCDTVGPAVFVPSPWPSPMDVTDIAVVNWNAHAGHGRLRRLIRAVRSGSLTGGTPPGGFVILLQEAVRRGAGVPEFVPDSAPVPDYIGDTSTADGNDVVTVAAAEGLSVLYAPSMRNGRHGVVAEDRGNAVLTTFELGAPLAIELPFIRQRRVAVAATIHGIRVASVHLDATTGPRSAFLFTGVHRERQADAFVDALDDENLPAIVGADLNTWTGGVREPAFTVLAQRFPRTRSGRTFARWQPLDYLLFGVPESWSIESHAVDDDFGSDHRPIVTAVRRLPRHPAAIDRHDGASDVAARR